MRLYCNLCSYGDTPEEGNAHLGEHWETSLAKEFPDERGLKGLHGPRENTERGSRDWPSFLPGPAVQRSGAGGLWWGCGNLGEVQLHPRRSCDRNSKGSI